MGIGPGYRHRTSTEAYSEGYQAGVASSNNYTRTTGNPDPNNYKILDFNVCHKSVVLKIKYLDCTNYEGSKILVYRNIDLRTVLTQSNGIDPHFNKPSKGSVYPFARFEPTEDGWKAALALAASL